MNTQKSSIPVLISITDLTICLLQNQIPFVVLKKCSLLRVYSNFETMNNLYVFEFCKGEVLLNSFSCCSSAYLGMLYRYLVGSPLEQVPWRSREEIEELIPICNLFGKISMHARLPQILNVIEARTRVVQLLIEAEAGLRNLESFQRVNEAVEKELYLDSLQTFDKALPLSFKIKQKIFKNLRPLGSAQ